MATTGSTPFSIERFARVYTKGPEELPAQADTYHNPERGWYFKLHLDGIATREAQPVIEKASDHFVVELVERMNHGEVFKERVYVEDASEVPEGFKVHTGPKGGLYYESGVQRVGSEDGEERDVAVIHWDDVEEGDDIVYETPEGEETFAEIVSIEERGDRADVIHVSIDGESERAMPGTYTVDKSDGVYVPRRHLAKEWISYEGPQGGQGWYNTASGELRYQETKPGEEGEGEEPESTTPDADPSEPPGGEWPPGWMDPPEDPTDLESGQAVEYHDGQEYHVGSVITTDEDSVSVQLAGGVAEVVSPEDVTAVEDTSDPSDEEDAEEPAEGYEIWGEDSDPLVELVQGDGFQTADGELDVGFEPYHYDHEAEWADEPGVPFYAGPSSYDNSAIDVEMTLDDYMDLQEYIGTQLGIEYGGTAEEWWDQTSKENIEQYTRILEGEEEPGYGMDGLPMPFVVIGDDGGLHSTQEGRHRALAAQAAGLDSVPVRLYHEHGKEGSVDLEPRMEKAAPQVYDLGKQEDVWTFFVGPNGGEGWLNVATGEKRYQRQRPGEAPEDGDGYGDWVGEGWEEAPEDFDELREGQTVEFFTDGDYYEGRVDIIDDEGEYVKIDTDHQEPNGLVMADGSGDELTAVEEYDDNFAFEGGQPVHLRTDDLEEDHPEYVDETGTIEPTIYQGKPLYNVVDENGTVAHQLWEDELRDMMVDDKPIPEGALVDIEWDESDHPIEAEVEWVDDELGFRVKEGMYEGAWVHSDEVHNSDELVSDGSDEEGDDDIPPEEQEFLEGVGLEAGDTFQYEGNEVIVTGATSMGGPDKDYVEVYIPSTEAHLPLHPNSVPDVALDEASEDDEDGDILGDIEDEIASLGGDDDEGAESPPEQEEPEADPTGPSEDEMDDAVAEPPPEDTGDDSAPTAGYDMSGYDPADVEEWGSLSEFGFPGGVTAHAMSVGALPEYDDTNESPENNAGLVFRTEFAEGDEGAKPDLGLRQMVTHDIGQALDARMPQHTGHPTEEGWVASEGVDGKMAQHVDPGVVDQDDFMEQAAKQVILGNNDAHSQNVLVDPDGKVWAIDIDHSGGDMMDGFVGNKTWYGDAIDRATGELVETAETLGLDVSQQEIIDRAEEVAQQYVDDETVSDVILEAAQDYDVDLAQNVENNLQNFANGSITLEQEL